MKLKLIGAVGALAVGLGLLALWQVPAAEATDCQRSCHQSKSTAYERCRRIPPAERNTRVSCFRQADEALQRCLASCR